MPWKSLEDIFAGSLEDVLKTSWRRLQNVLKMSWRRLEDVLKIYGQHKYLGLDQDVVKASSRRLDQDVFWRRRRKTSSRRLQDVFIKTNVCWVVTIYNATKTWASSNNFWVKLQYNFFVEDLPVAAFTDQLKAFLIRAP